MKLRIVLAALSLSFAATARADEVAVPSPSLADALRGTVLVWQDAAFSGDASGDGQVVRAANAQPRAEHVGRVVPMRVLGTKGDFVEVEPVEDGGCAWARVALTDDLQHVRLFVRRADIAPVLAKPFAKAFPDGTRISFAPGVPVLKTAGGYSVSLRGTPVTLEIPDASVGWSYAGERAKGKAAIAAHEFALAAKTPVGLGAQQIVVGPELAQWHASAREVKGDTALATFEERCTTVTIAAPARALAEVDEEGAGSLSLGGDGSATLELRDQDYLPLLTAVFSGAHQVAIVAKPIYLQVMGSGKQVCIDRRLRIVAAIFPPDTTDLDDKLHLCAPASKVKHEKLRSSSSANGTTHR